MRMLFRSLVALCWAGPWAAPLWAQGIDADGLRAPPGESVWPRWQARLTVASPVSPWWRPQAGDDSDGQGSRLSSLSLFGDYFFRDAAPGLGGRDGLRATSGLIRGHAAQRAMALSAPPAALGVAAAGRGLHQPTGAWTALPQDAVSTVPYLGLGYSAASARGGWGFSADIGMVARSPGSAVKLGRVFSGPQALDELLRDMRLSPLVNVGVSYSF